MDSNQIKVGMLVRVTGNSASHGYKVGEIYRVHSFSGYRPFLSTPGSGIQGTTVTNPQDLEYVAQTRAEHAAYLEEYVIPGEVAKLEAQTKLVDDLKGKAARYKKYPTREEEYADLLCQAFATKGDKAAVLEFIKTSGILSVRPDEL